MQRSDNCVWALAMGILLVLTATPAALRAQEYAVTFVAEGIRLGIATDGKVFEIVDTVTQKNRNFTPWPQYQQVLCKIKVGGALRDPTEYSFAGERLTYTFGGLNPAPVVTVRVEEKPSYLVLTLESLTNESGVEAVRFVNLGTRDSQTGTAFRYLTYDDDGNGQVDRILAVYPLDIYTQTEVGPAGAGGYLWASAYPDLPHPTPVPMVGRRVALFTCPTSRDGVYGVAEQIDSDYPEYFRLGVATKRQPALKRSCFFWMDFTGAQKDLVLQYTQAAGAGKILLLHSLWGDPYRKYAPAEMWGGMAALQNWVNQCKAAGLAVGVHLYPTVIYKNSIDYIRAGCDPRMARDRPPLTLAADFPAGQTEGLIETSTPPTDWPMAATQRDIVIGQEIIEYTGLQLAGPSYGLTGPFVRAKNQGGEGGLGPRDHAAGAAVGHLHSSIPGSNRYLWDIGSGGVAQWCADMAGTLDQAGFQFIYTDGIEGVESPVWYTHGYSPYVMCTAMANVPLWMEGSSNTGCFSWPLMAIVGQIDYYPDRLPYKSEVERNLQNFEALAYAIGYVPGQLGWARLCVPGAAQTTPDELEYLLARSVAYDMPIVFQIWMTTLEQWHCRDANLGLIAKYEQARLEGSIPSAQRAAARTPGRDFMLFTDDVGQHHLAMVTILNVANLSSNVRGYITNQHINGHRYATLWPTAAGSDKTICLPGVTPGDVIVKDVAGTPVDVLDVGGGKIAIPLAQRVYVKLQNVPDPRRTFGQAAVQDGEPGSGQ